MAGKTHQWSRPRARVSRAFYGHRRTTATTAIVDCRRYDNDDDDAVAATGRWEKARDTVQEELFGDNRKRDDGGRYVAAISTAAPFD